MKFRACVFLSILVITLSASPWNHILRDYSITDIIPYENGYWVATESEGAFRYEALSGKWFRYNKSNGIMSENDNINDMKMMNGRIWFATNYGIYTCTPNGENWQHTLLPGGIYANWVRAFDATSDKAYIAGFTGLFTYSFSTNSFTEIGNLKPDYYQTSYTNSIYAADSVVWIGTDDGVFHYDTSMPISNDSSITYYSKSNGIPTTSDLVMCRSLYANEQGLWLGLDEYTSTHAPNYCQGGLFSFDGNRWIKFDESTGLPADGIHFIQEYDNKIYAGLFHYVDGVNFDGAGMLVLDLADSSWVVLNDKNWHIGNDSVRSFYCTASDTLVGTDHGLFTNVDSLPDLAPYNAPDWFALRSLGNGDVEIKIDSVNLATHYTVYAHNPVFNTMEIFRNVQSCDTLRSFLHNDMYIVKVLASNQFGDSPFCKDVLCVEIGETNNPILIIQSFDYEMQDNTNDFCIDHAQPMHNAGLGFDAISDEALWQTNIDLNNYSMIDWVCGRDRKIINEYTKAKIKEYLESGGNLFISAEQIIENVSGNSENEQFYADYLKAIRKKPDARTYGILTITEGIFDGIENFSFDDGTQGTYNASQPDGFKAVGGAVPILLYADKDSSSTGVAALSYEGKFGDSDLDAKLVYMGIPYECIYPDSLQQAVMLSVLNYFDFNVTLSSYRNIDLPGNAKLHQNYPNPFNPITKITYSLPESELINISIYDLSGRLITTIFNGLSDAGTQDIIFDAADLSSGVYICRLQAGEAVRSMKMLLLK